MPHTQNFGQAPLFSHGQFSRALATRWIELSVAESQHLSLGTASLSILGFDPSHPKVRVIELWNAAPAMLVGLS
jgi:probable phosphoglycerate mutase